MAMWREASVAIRVSVALVTAISVVLLAGGVLVYNRYAEERRAAYENAIESAADKLESGLAIAAWNIDLQQIWTIKSRVTTSVGL